MDRRAVNRMLMADWLRRGMADAAPSESALAFSDLMAAVGEVLLRWGYLELEMLKKLEIVREGSMPRASPLQQWRAAGARALADVSPWAEEIARAAQIRNLLAHGLIGGHAQPEAGAPHVVCRDLDGASHEIKHADLIATAQHLDVLRLRLCREPDDLLCPPPVT